MSEGHQDQPNSSEQTREIEKRRQDKSRLGKDKPRNNNDKPYQEYISKRLVAPRHLLLWIQKTNACENRPKDTDIRRAEFLIEVGEGEASEDNRGPDQEKLLYAVQVIHDK